MDRNKYKHIIPNVKLPVSYKDCAGILHCMRYRKEDGVVRMRLIELVWFGAEGYVFEVL